MSNVILESSRGLQPVPVEDELFRNREIFLTGGVDRDTCGEMIKQVMYLESKDPSKEITVYINSPGGSVQDGLALYDMLILTKAPVRTVCMGTCASMGAIIFLAGRKREMMEHGKIMIHDPAFGCFLQAPFGKSCNAKMDNLACPKWTMLQPGTPAYDHAGVIPLQTGFYYSK